MGAGALASAGANGSFDEVPESNSPPRERRKEKAWGQAHTESQGTGHSQATPAVSMGRGGRVQRRRKRKSRRKWWRDVPPAAFTLSMELDQQLDQITANEGLPRDQASTTVVSLADALGVPTAKRDEWAQASEIPPVVRFRRVLHEDASSTEVSASDQATLMSVAPTTKVNPTTALALKKKVGNRKQTKQSIKDKRTPISSLCENLRLLDSGDATPAAKRALLKMTLSMLLGGQDDRDVSGEKLKEYCQQTRIRVFRLAAHDLGIIEDQLCIKIRDNERFQEELGPLMRIIESGERLDPSAKRAILRAIMRDAKSPKQVTSPVKRAAEEVGETGPSLAAPPQPSSYTTLQSDTTTRYRQEENGIDGSDNGSDATTVAHLVHTHTLIALLACLEDVARLTPAEIRALLAHLFSVISVQADLDSFVDFVLDTRLRSVWKAAMQSGLVLWDDSRRQYSFMHSVLGTSDIGISWPKE